MKFKVERLNLVLLDFKSNKKKLPHVDPTHLEERTEKKWSSSPIFLVPDL